MLTLSSYLNTEKETRVLYIHKFGYLFLEVPKVAERNQGKKAEKEIQDKMTSQCLITFSP